MFCCLRRARIVISVASPWEALISVLYVGHHKNGNDCEMCTGNTIKSKIGDASDCSADTPCDGVTEVPDANHTHCGL